jgi:hypothetical protein
MGNDDRERRVFEHFTSMKHQYTVKEVFQRFDEQCNRTIDTRRKRSLIEQSKKVFDWG